MHEYLFDVKLFAAIRVKADSVEAARDLLRTHVESADCNFGAWPNGDPITGEASVDDDELPCIEVDGNPAVDEETGELLDVHGGTPT